MLLEENLNGTHNENDTPKKEESLETNTQLENEEKTDLENNASSNKSAESSSVIDKIGSFVLGENSSPAESIDLEKDEYDDDEDENSNHIDDKSSPEYSNLSKDELLNVLSELIHNKHVEEIRSDVEIIKSCYYKLINTEKDRVRKELTESGAEDEIEIPKDPSEDYLKELLSVYRDKKQAHIEELEKEKEDNLKKKESIIEQIRILANGEESLNKTFSEFKELQKQWTEIGPVPSASSNTLWNNYQLQIERFYDFIKINKELRDLDLKKNLEMKLELCEKTEDLLLESDVRKAYKILQEYHDNWKEIGPVDLDKKEEIWNRFSEATKKIRKSYQDYFINIRKERENNYKQKQALCEKVEEINNLDTPKTRKQWVDTSKEILELQKVWKTIGMVPKEVNEEVYQRFRAACNKFFDDKKEFFNVINEELNKNLQQKIDICVQAESAKDSQDWKKTTELFFDLQKKWKAVGTVPGKQSDIVWKRFRKACDHFFNAKESFFGDLIKEQDDNAKKKEELIEKINNFEPLEEQAENIKKIKELQSEWIKIGMVPRKLKDKLQDSYRDSISKLYDKLNLSKKQIDSQNYKTRIEVFKTTEDSKQLNIEKSKIQTKIKAIEDDIRLWENNMTFFSGGAKSLVSDFNDKISKAKEEINVLKNRIKMIDLAEREIEQNQKGENNEQ